MSADCTSPCEEGGYSSIATVDVNRLQAHGLGLALEELQKRSVVTTLVTKRFLVTTVVTKRYVVTTAMTKRDPLPLP